MLRPAVPMPRVEFAWLKVERSEGSWFSASPSDRLPSSTSSAAVSWVIGTGESSAVAPAMREPVTRTVSLGSVEASAAQDERPAVHGVLPHAARRERRGADPPAGARAHVSWKRADNRDGTMLVPAHAGARRSCQLVAG